MGVLRPWHGLRYAIEMQVQVICNYGLQHVKATSHLQAHLAGRTEIIAAKWERLRRSMELLAN